MVLLVGVTLLKVLDGKEDEEEDGVILDTEEVVRDDTEETVVDRGRYVVVLLLTLLGGDGLVGVESTEPVRDRLANDMVLD